MQTFLTILCSSAVAAVINGVFNLINTLVKNKCLAICKRNTELETENTALKQSNSDLEKRLQEYEAKDSVEFKSQFAAQNYQSEANSSFLNWND